MEKIRGKKQEEEKVISEAKKAIIKIIDDFKVNEKKIGKELADAFKETRDEMSFVGKCPVCKKGDLQVRRGKFGQFIACSKYPDCKTTFSLPAGVLVRSAKKECSECSYPMVIIIRRGKRPQEVCINPKCPSKKIDVEKNKDEGKECPSCKKGKLILRKSIYGSFLGCSNYPKCRYVQKL
jgi:DNA topoisomerase-1